MNIDERLEALTMNLELMAAQQKHQDERVEALTQSLELQVSLQADAAKRHEEAMARHDEGIARHDEAIARHDEAIARHDREIAEIRESQAKTENALRQAIRLSVQDARRQRTRNREFAEGMAELRTAHAATEASLKAFIDGMRGGGNGHPKG
jgi:hypothetical protein